MKTTGLLRLGVGLLAFGLVLGCSDNPADAPHWELTWSSGFENGFPGEWFNYDNGSYTNTGALPVGANNAWTIVDTGQGEVYSGDYAYKGWIVDAQSESHRPYPGIHCDIPSPMVNTFVVWLDADYGSMGVSQWIHFATWGNNPNWQVFTMAVRNRRLEMAHLNWSYVGPTPQSDFPLRQWVRFTAYIDLSNNGYVKVWQDGVAVFIGNYTTVSGSRLVRAHWGMYASGGVSQGTQYNDDIEIWTTGARLDDLDTEPLPPGYPGG